MIDTDNRVKELADTISNFTNSLHHGYLKELGIAMTQDHRTLVQSKMHIVMSFLSELSDMHAHGHYDLRNEAACKLADKMLSALSEQDKCLPFV